MIGAPPLISVIIPTYNRERHLPQCLGSVLSQTYSNLEAIVIDDGSTDGTPDLMAEIQARDQRVRYLQKPNGGVSSARNMGIRAAQGELIALLDSDDAWLPWKLELQQAALQALPNAGMIWTDMASINEQGLQIHDRYLRRMYGCYQKLTGPLFQQSMDLDISTLITGRQGTAKIWHGGIYPQMLRGNLVHTSTVLMHKARALQTGLFDESYRRAGEDFGFHLRTCRLGDVAFFDESTTLYRIGAEDQLTHRRFQISLAQAFLRTITDEARLMKKDFPLTRAELNQVLSEAHCWLGSELLTANQRSTALPHLLEAVKQDRRNLSAWRQLVRMVTPRPVQRLLRKLRMIKSPPIATPG